MDNGRKATPDELQSAVREASVLVERRLSGDPLVYEVLADCAAYAAPGAQAARLHVFEKGQKVSGFPGSPAWVRLLPGSAGANASGSHLLLMGDAWLPVRSQDRLGTREQVLKSGWAELRDVNMTDSLIDLKWLGIAPPAAPQVLEYELEWRVAGGGPAGQRTCSRAAAMVGNLQAETDYQFRVTMCLRQRGDQDLRLSGPWKTLRTARLQRPVRRVAESGPNRERVFEVVHRFVVVRDRPGLKAKPVAASKLGEQMKGWVEAVDGLTWLRLSPQVLAPPASFRVRAGEERWALIDATGTDLGVGMLLKEISAELPETAAAPPALRRVAAPPSALSVSSAAGALAAFVVPEPEPLTRTPPSPVTVRWLAKYGDQLAGVAAAKEEALSCAVGGAVERQCTLLRVQPAAGVKESLFVAKRVQEGGDMFRAVQEHRFYCSGPGKRLPAGLAGLLRVPRCLLSTWRQDAPREEMLLVLERLGGPEWVHVDRGMSCSPPQAMLAADTLGRMHGLYASEQELAGLGWLSRGALDVRNGWVRCKAAISKLVEFGLPLAAASSPPVERAAAALTGGAMVRVLERLAEPPLTLVHGDFRPASLRFSACGSRVGALGWGRAHRGRGGWDLACLLVFGQAPEERRAREGDLIRRYLHASGGLHDGGQVEERLRGELQLAALALLGCALMALVASEAGRQAGGDEELVSKLPWLVAAIEDWDADEAIAKW